MEDKIIIEQYYNLKSCRAVAELYGCSAKYIQNICNRYKSKTGNAYGYHWEYIDKNVEHEDIKLKESEAV